MASQEKISVKDGPAEWHLMHSSAYEAQTEEEKQRVKWLIENICKHFRCKECSGHCKSYSEANPIQDSWTVMHNGRDVGLFIWTWKFHNAVNQRINKKVLDFETVLEMYSNPDNTTCHLQCSSEEEQQKPPAGTETKKPKYREINMTITKKKKQK